MFLLLRRKMNCRKNKVKTIFNLRFYFDMILNLNLYCLKKGEKVIDNENLKLKFLRLKPKESLNLKI